MTKSLDTFGREVVVGDDVLLRSKENKDIWARVTKRLPEGKIEIQVEIPESFKGQLATISSDVSIRLPLIYDFEASKAALSAGKMPVPKD